MVGIDGGMGNAAILQVLDIVGRKEALPDAALTVHNHRYSFAHGDFSGLQSAGVCDARAAAPWWIAQGAAFLFRCGRQRGRSCDGLRGGGSGNIVVNGKPASEYFSRETGLMVIRQPL